MVWMYMFPPNSYAEILTPKGDSANKKVGPLGGD